jgi:phage terminase large subunit-like protein
MTDYAWIEHVEINGYSPSATGGDCGFDVDSARRAIEFFPEFLRHTKGPLAGQPFELEPWQQVIIGTLFGWQRPDGTRRYRMAYIFIARKGGKSHLGAGIALELLYLDDEGGAEVYSCAADTDQAAIVFDVAKANVEQSELSELSELYRRSIVRKDEHTQLPVGTYKVLSADAKTKHGSNPHGVVFDELHAQTNAELWDVMTTGEGARTQPLVVVITTAGWDRNSICYEQQTYAERVRDGLVDDDEFLPVLYAANPEDDWKDPATWRKAQPNLGVSVSEDYYARKCKKATESPRFENTFKRLYLNLWTEQETRWLSMQHWDDCPKDLPSLEGERCYCGLDLSTTTDITAFVMVFQLDDGEFVCLPHFWVPGETARLKERKDKVPYSLWHREGFVTLTEDEVVDYEQIRIAINELGERYDIAEIACDRWNALQLMQQLEYDGFTPVAYSQGYGMMSNPSKELEKLVIGHKLNHGGNPVMRWMASNAVVKPDAYGNIKPLKDKSTGRIDGIVSLVMALGRSLTVPEEQGWSFADGAYM